MTGRARRGRGCGGRPGSPAARPPARSGGRGGWPPTPPSARRWPPGSISASWAREICAWTAKLPEGKQADADAILLAAAAGGAELADLAGLAEEMRRRCAQPDTDGDDGFADRWLRLDRTLHGAGRVEGDLTPQCTAALDAVLDAFAKKTGPEDTRTKGQRDP